MNADSAVKKGGTPYMEKAPVPYPSVMASGCLPGMAPTYSTPPKSGTAETALSAYRRTPCAGTERARTKEYFRFLYVGLL